MYVTSFENNNTVVFRVAQSKREGIKVRQVFVMHLGCVTEGQDIGARLAIIKARLKRLFGQPLELTKMEKSLDRQVRKRLLS
jgi:hypothetical protein